MNAETLPLESQRSQTIGISSGAFVPRGGGDGGSARIHRGRIILFEKARASLARVTPSERAGHNPLAADSWKLFLRVLLISRCAHEGNDLSLDRTSEASRRDDDAAWQKSAGGFD